MENKFNNNPLGSNTAISQKEQTKKTSGVSTMSATQTEMQQAQKTVGTYSAPGANLKANVEKIEASNPEKTCPPNRPTKRVQNFYNSRGVESALSALETAKKNMAEYSTEVNRLTKAIANLKADAPNLKYYCYDMNAPKSVMYHEHDGNNYIKTDSTVYTIYMENIKANMTAFYQKINALHAEVENIRDAMIRYSRDFKNKNNIISNTLDGIVIATDDKFVNMWSDDKGTGRKKILDSNATIVKRTKNVTEEVIENTNNTTQETTNTNTNNSTNTDHSTSVQFRSTTGETNTNATVIKEEKTVTEKIIETVTGNKPTESNKVFEAEKKDNKTASSIDDKVLQTETTTSNIGTGTGQSFTSSSPSNVGKTVITYTGTASENTTPVDPTEITEAEEIEVLDLEEGVLTSSVTSTKADDKKSYVKIPTVKETVKKPNYTIPTLAGLGAAVGAGVGAKVYMDKHAPYEEDEDEDDDYQMEGSENDGLELEDWSSIDDDLDTSYEEPETEMTLDDDKINEFTADSIINKYENIE